MAGACAACGTDDELLFTCRHCERRFCERHERPHHACERFRKPDTGGVSDPESGATAVVATVPAGESTETERPPEHPPERSTTGHTGRESAAPDPGRAGTDEEPPDTEEVRPMDSRRAVGVVSRASTPHTMSDWLGRQTYLTLLVKVGGLALIINAAFYGGVALTLYDPFGLL